MPIFQRGKTWWGSYTTPSGERIRTSLKTTDKKEAEEVFDKIRHDMWRKEHVGAGNLKKTWDEAALKWLDEKAHKRSNYLRQDGLSETSNPGHFLTKTRPPRTPSTVRFALQCFE